MTTTELKIDVSGKLKASYSLKGKTTLNISGYENSFLDNVESISASGSTLTLNLTSGKKLKFTSISNPGNINFVGDYTKSLQGFFDEVKFADYRTYAVKNTTISGTVFDDVLNMGAWDEPTAKNKAKNIGLTINSANGNDVITGTKYNDTITGGAGINTVQYAAENFGNDTIKLTKGETLNITGLDFDGIEKKDRLKAGKNKNDLLITSKYGTITIKNYYGKTTGATVYINSVDCVNMGNDAGAIMDQYKEMVDSVTGANTFNANTKITTYTGSALADRMTANDMTERTDKKGNVIKDKGLTINSGLGNDRIRATNFNDVINTGAGDDYIWATKGNDTITGGAGNNTIYYGHINGTAGYENHGNDTIKLTKGETLTVTGLSFTGTDEKEKYTLKNKNDLLITTQYGTVTIKDYAGKNTGAKVTINGYDLTTKQNIYYDKDDISKNILTGSTLADNIDASDAEQQFKTTGKKKVATNLVIKGNGGDDIITGSAYSDTIYAGTGVDTITGGTGDDILYGGTTTDSKTKYMFYNGDGNDIVNAGKGTETVVFYSNSYDRLTYTKSGKNLIIGYNMNPEGQTQDSVTIKNYFDKKGNVVSKVKYIGCTQGIFELEALRSIANNEGKYTVNSGTDGNDNVLTKDYSPANLGNGDDTIYLSGGAHMTLGHGKKTMIAPADDYNHVVEFETPEDLELKFYKTDNDLIIKYKNNGWENDSITVKDYFVKGKYINLYYMNTDMNIQNYIASYGTIVTGEGLIEGTTDTDIIYGSDKADTIYITDNDSVYPGKGNDTLIWKKDSTSGGVPVTMGQQKVYLKNGDGNNTFIFEAQPSSYWQLHFEEDTTLKYERKGNDLLIHSTYNDGTKNITETQTIKDWAVSELSGGRILLYQGELDGSSKYTILAKDTTGLDLQSFSTDSSLGLNIYGSDGNDLLSTKGTNINAYGYDGDDLYYLKGTNVVTTDTKGNEEYRGYALQKKATVNDSDGNDSLIMYDETLGKLNDNMDNRQLHLMFNVTKDYKATDGVSAVGDVIVTSDASKENYDLWQTDGLFKGISIKNNAIETINTADETPYAISNSDVATLAEDVAGWLTTNGYADVNAVFSKAANETDIATLIAQFDNANWQLA